MREWSSIYLLMGAIVMSGCVVTTKPIAEMLDTHKPPRWIVYAFAATVIVLWPVFLLFFAIAQLNRR